MASDQREFENPGQFELDDDFFVTDDEDASIYELTGMYKTDDEAISIELAGRVRRRKPDSRNRASAAAVLWANRGRAIAAVPQEGPGRIARIQSTR